MSTGKKVDNITEIEFKDPISPFTLRLNHGENKIIIEYEKSIFNNTLIVDDRPFVNTTYENNLEYIKSRIDWCIRKSFEKTKKDHENIVCEFCGEKNCKDAECENDY